MKKLYNLVNRDVLKERILQDPTERTTLSFYKYLKIADTKQYRNQLYLKFDELGVLGRVYVANEGVNGQISVPAENLEAFRLLMVELGFDQIRLNIAIEDNGKSFIKLKIKVRNKIVADGLDDDSFDVTDRGTHINAEEFNDLTNRDDTVVIDMRNHYETEIGHFKDAICPDVTTFRESLPIVEDILQEHEDKNIVMYCTGGIRCEKASAFFKHRGFKKVFQLDGGIIEYARQVKEQGLENKFVGKNFVFDERMGERISEDIIAKCHQCGNPADTHINCANDACHLLFIQCEDCATKFQKCCCDDCKDFIQLSPEDQKERRKTASFPGSKFAKGRYKSYRPE